jgi:hypothetical protein
MIVNLWKALGQIMIHLAGILHLISKNLAFPGIHRVAYPQIRVKPLQFVTNRVAKSYFFQIPS